MKIAIPELCLVALIGPTGSGKSSFAASHFKPTEVVSSDSCRAMVADDATDQAATPDAFALLNFIAATRLRAGRLTVIDATSVQQQARKSLVALAKEHDCLPVAIVLNMPEALCLARNKGRADRPFGPQVVRRPAEQLRRSLRGLKRKGFRHVFVLNSPEEVEAATVERVPLWVNLQHEHGPFDIIGDVHGCYDELAILLERLGYRLETRADADGETGFSTTHPEGRKAVFVGDLVDRGPGVAKVLKLVMAMASDGVALCVAGNHESKLVRKLRGQNVQVSHGLAESLAQLELESPAFRQRVAEFLDGLISHYVLDDGGLVVAHAGMKSEYQGRASARVRDFCLYGETTGETDEFGLPVRGNWAAGYRGRAMVVYGHTPVVDPAWLNSTINIDTGCVFGGKLTALRYPEKELVSVPAARVYYEPAKPLASAARTEEPSATAEARAANLLDIDDVLGKRIVATRLRGNITVREENATAALEVMSRFALAPAGWCTFRPPCPHATAPDSPVCWNIQLRYLPTFATTACPAWSAKKNIWVHGPSSWRGGTPQRSSGGSASPARELAPATHGQEEGSLKTAPSRRSFWNVSARRLPTRVFGRNWGPTGWCWTVNSCRGPSRRRGCSANSMRR